MDREMDGWTNRRMDGRTRTGRQRVRMGGELAMGLMAAAAVIMALLPTLSLVPAPDEEQDDRGQVWSPVKLKTKCS